MLKPPINRTMDQEAPQQMPFKTATPPANRTLYPPVHRTLRGLPTLVPRPSRDPLNRSQAMSRIRGRDTRPELLIRSLLHREGARFRVSYKVPGICKVDIAFTRVRLAIFIDGCFWHGCPEHAVEPKTNKDFWTRKLARNLERDKEQVERMQASGWESMRFWEHEVETSPGLVVRRILGRLARRRGLGA